MNPILSIIVPVYNVENYLRQCIESILKQTFTDFELILVNDGSPDSSPVICDEYAKKDSRIKVLHKENGGLISARKAGLEVANGQYIGFVDSDDWIEPNMYEEFYTAMATGVDIAICGFYINFQDVEKTLSYDTGGFYNKKSLIHDIYPTMLYKGGYYEFGIMPSVWSKVFKRKLLLSHLPSIDNRINIGEDAACTFPCLLNAESIYILKDSHLYHYRQNNLSMTKSYRKNYFETNIILFELLKKSFSSHDYQSLQSQLQYYIVYLTLSAVVNEMSNSNKKSMKEKIQYIRKNVSVPIIKTAFKAINEKEFPSKYRIYVKLINYNLVELLIYKWSIQKGINKIQKYKRDKQ